MELGKANTPARARHLRPRRGAAAAAALALTLLAAGCGAGGLAGGLRPSGAGAQPDEFLVLPTRPLEMPPDLSALPPPTPGVRARVAYDPRAEAMAALGGRPAAAAVGGEALVAAAGRADPAIRARLAAEDAAFRRESRPRPLDRLFGLASARAPYRAVTLDAERELARLRAAGVRTPAAPPGN
jgi:hypothetical protein